MIRYAMISKTAIVIPAHNEEEFIEQVIKEAEKYGRIIVVNDCSKDDTEKIAKKSGAIVITHKVNMGLGKSLRDGFQKALDLGFDTIITIDADGQHDPKEIPRFMEEINNGSEFVLGARNLRKYPFVKKFGNFFLNTATNFISGTQLKDTESGFRAFSRESLKKLNLKADRYQIAVEIIFEVGRNKLISQNVPINSTIYVQGVGVKDGLKNFYYLLHRRERKWRDYINDVKYVFKKHLDKY